MSTHELYRKIQAVNFSSLKWMEVSPLRYHHSLSEPYKDTDSMRCGRLDHCAVFQPDTAELWPLWHGGDRRGKDWTAFRAAHGEDYVWKQKELDDARRLRLAIASNPHAAVLLQHGNAETSHCWTDPETQVRCKGRVDWISGETIVELKTTKNALSARTIARQIAAYHYHAQAAFYLDGTGSKRFVWIFAEQAEPHDVAVVPATEAMLAEGRALYGKWLARLAQCRQTNTWPGVAPEPLEIELPLWAMANNELELTAGGEGIDL